MSLPLLDVFFSDDANPARFGGSGTTANTFMYLLWACLQKPQVVAKLQAELFETFRDPSVVPDYRVSLNYFSHLKSINE